MNNSNLSLCTWKEQSNNPDWFYCGCIRQKVNIWKTCKKKHITPVQIFQSCPYCGRRVNLERVEK